MTRLDLIFVHVPKAGGSAVNKVLEQHFGPALLRDSDRPGNPIAPMNMDPQGFLLRAGRDGFPHLQQKRAVTGHIWIRKYDDVAADVRATVLRHPVARTISNYFFWQHWADTPTVDHPLQMYLRENHLSIIEFAKLPIFRWFYINHIFRDTDMTLFDVLIDYDELNNDGRSVMRRIGIENELPRDNETINLYSDYSKKKLEIIENKNIMTDLADILSDDIKF